MTVNGDGVSHHTYADIGFYTVFPDNHYKRMFPTKAFGRIEEIDYKNNNVFGLMTREEGLRITNELNRLTLPKDRKINYKDIGTKLTNTQTRQEIIKD